MEVLGFVDRIMGAGWLVIDRLGGEDVLKKSLSEMGHGLQ